MRRTDEKRQLRGWARAKHFAPAITFAVFAAFCALLALTKPSSPDTYPVSFVGVSALLAALALWWHRHVLRFAVVETERDPDQNYERVLDAAGAAGWEVVATEPGHTLEARVAGFPRSLLSWGEAVVVRFEGQRVYVNSICDPDLNPSVTAWGRNSRNMETVSQALRAV